MTTHVNIDAITDLFKQANNEGRDYLFEHEVYSVIKNMGADSVPLTCFLPKDSKPDMWTLSEIHGDKIVVKVVSPSILHKSDVGGVIVVDKGIDDITSAIREMTRDIPVKFAGLIDADPGYAPQKYVGLKKQNLEAAICSDIAGFLLCQYMPPEFDRFGNELFVSLRCTREFGMVISAGLGGTDTELYARQFKKGNAVVAASTEMTDGPTFFDFYTHTISYKKLAGLTRDQKRAVSDKQLLDCFTAFIELANHFSPFNSNSDIVIQELEINPFAFNGFRMMPLDGLCRFSLKKKRLQPRPVHRIDKLLHPASMAIVGVSAKEENMGRIILKNTLANGFDKENLLVIHPKAKSIDGVRAVPDIHAIDKKLDLMVFAVSASQIPDLVAPVIKNNLAESVILIPGGLGEKKGNEKTSDNLKQMIQSARAKDDSAPVFLGGNSLGVLSHPGRFDTLFVPETKLSKHRGDHDRISAFISQSGAYMITRMSKLSFFDPAYAISIGNQIDLTAADIMKFINTLDDITIISVYMEGFNEFDGLEFLKAIRDATSKGKQVIFYKAGRTAEGKTATSGHTASIAGDYMVCESCVHQAGAIVAKSFTEFDGLLKLARTLHLKKITGNRLAAISNAGYESVGIADNIIDEDYSIEIAALMPETIRKLSTILKKNSLDNIVNIINPLDVTPMAGEDVYEASIKALLDDPQTDVVIAAIVPLTPVMDTLPGKTFSDKPFDSEKSIARRLPQLAEQYEKPLVMVIDSGPLYDPLADALQEKGLPVFRSADQAVWVLGKYIQGRLRIDSIQQSAKRKTH